MEKWISAYEQLPCEDSSVLIWDGRCHIAKLRTGIDEQTREAMKSGTLDDPVSIYWSKSTGYTEIRRSEIYTSADVHGNNAVPYCWDEVAGPHSWRGQNIKFWMPLPARPEEGNDV